MKSRNLMEFEDRSIVTKSLDNSSYKKNFLKHFNGCEQIEETENDNTETFNEYESSKNA